MAPTVIGAKRKRSIGKFGCRKLHLGVDEVQPIQADRLVAPRLVEAARRIGARLDGGNRQLLEGEVHLDQRLVGEVERGPAAELALGDGAAERIDRQRRSGLAHVGGAGDRFGQRAGRLDLELERLALVVVAARHRALEGKAQLLLAKPARRRDVEAAVRLERSFHRDGGDAVLDLAGLVAELDRTVLDDEALDGEPLRDRSGGLVRGPSRNAPAGRGSAGLAGSAG